MNVIQVANGLRAYGGATIAIDRAKLEQYPINPLCVLSKLLGMSTWDAAIIAEVPAEAFDPGPPVAVKSLEEFQQAAGRLACALLSRWGGGGQDANQLAFAAYDPWAAVLDARDEAATGESLAA